MSFSISFNQIPTETLRTNLEKTCCECNHDVITKLNPDEVAKKFCDLYYSNTIKGFSNILQLFEPDANCSYGGQECIGMYGIMTMLGSEGIASMRYDNLKGSVIPINKEYMTVQIIGLCQGVTFWKELTNVREFSETFVLKYNENNNITISGYNFRLI